MAKRLVADLCGVVAVLTGLSAAFCSQASSPDYAMLFVSVLAMTLVTVTCAAVNFCGTTGGFRHFAWTCACLAVAGSAELGTRIVGAWLVWK